MVNGLFKREKGCFNPSSGCGYEKSAWRANLGLIGVDEVGRGCLAGPLVAAAVELPQWATRSPKVPILRDSKQMTERQRLVSCRWIMDHCRYGIGIIHPRSVDRFNVWGATLLAMKRAIFSLLATRPAGVLPETIVVDAMPVDLFGSAYASISICSFPRAEQVSISVAAASILAKVQRDQLMAQLDAYFPVYGLAGHKGYATRIHRGALLGNGHSLIHRLSFLSRQQREREVADSGRQSSIC